MADACQTTMIDGATATILLDLLSSSSSDDDELLRPRGRQEIPKIVNFMGVIDSMSDIEFKKNFRLERHTAEMLTERFKASQYFPSATNHGGSTPISAEIHVLLFIWFAANKIPLRTVSQRFGVGTTTSSRIISRLMAFLMSIAPQIIKFPEDNETAAQDFREISNFPDTVGCIDGTSITIRTPRHKIKSTYTNRHDIPAITMQGICDSSKRFIDVFTGIPGKIHDSRVLKLSDIAQELPARLGRQYHLLGDGAYAIREWLLIPFRDYGALTAAERNYNRQFCATRVLIENAFGLLKGRWKQLLQIDMHKIDKISKFIISCCVLHNICINSNDIYICDEPYEELDDLELERPQDNNDEELRRLGEEKRSRIKESLLVDLEV